MCAILWTTAGECIGVFGQEIRWKLGVPASYGLHEVEDEHEHEHHQDDSISPKDHTAELTTLQSTSAASIQDLVQSCAVTMQEFMEATATPRLGMHGVQLARPSKRELSHRRATAMLETPLGPNMNHLSPHTQLTQQTLSFVPQRTGRQKTFHTGLGATKSRGQPGRPTAGFTYTRRESTKEL
eukprot:TRINITY_DN63841_c0_g1_i1.p1 TRINITY_DN63841_c0_g1~~TRINITY_DN63841_c0_g1_i1.p1  ORF type:complete len:183 (+),score=20.54 TRINITY_DN63841_c0_g1_i1:1-549(+)